MALMHISHSMCYVTIVCHGTAGCLTDFINWIGFVQEEASLGHKLYITLILLPSDLSALKVRPGCLFIINFK